MDIFKWFRNDLKDLDKDVSIDKEVDSIVKSYKKKGTKPKKEDAKKEPSLASSFRKKMKEEKGKREKKKEEKKEDYGTITSDDIANSKRKVLFKYGIKFAVITFIVIMITALYRLSVTGVPKPVAKVNTAKVLEGLESEDDDYADSRTRAQIQELAMTVKRLADEGKEKESAVQQALLEEAKKNKELKEKLSLFKTKLEEAKHEQNASIGSFYEEKLAKLEEKVKRLTDRPSASNSSHKIQPLPHTDEDDILVEPVKMGKEPTIQYQKLSPKEVEKIDRNVTNAVKAIQDEYEYSNVDIIVMSQSNDIDDHIKEVNKTKKYPLHIMTGFVKATLITGVDAPTFGAGKANPVPVILSINSEEIIANGFDADIEDCMLIGQAFGNMATSRAEIEVTRISCNIKRDGVLYKIENGSKGWVYDENGIHGLKGRLVDSAGKIITKDVAVGFLQGVATAFSQPQTTINSTSGLATQVFDSGNLKDGVARGAGNGASSALNGLSEYYQKLLDGLYPFVSIRSGRSVTVLFRGGEDLQMTPYKRVSVESDQESLDEEVMEINLDGW